MRSTALGDNIVVPFNVFDFLVRVLTIFCCGSVVIREGGGVANPEAAFY